MSYKPLWKSHQIYNLGAVGNKDELIRFKGQKVSGTCETRCGQMSSLWGTFSPVCRMHWRIFSKTYRSYSLPGLHDLECHGFKDQGHRQQFL